MRPLIVVFKPGPMYLPVWISLCMTLVMWDLYCTIDLLLGGVWVRRMLGKSRWKPSWSPVRICSCSYKIFALCRNSFHVSGWYGVRGLSFLSSMTHLSSVSGLTASREEVTLVMASAVSTSGKLPVETQWGLVGLSDKTIVGVAQCEGTCAIPSGGFCAVVDEVFIMAQT